MPLCGRLQPSVLTLYFASRPLAQSGATLRGRMSEASDLASRADTFNLFNHANFGPPRNVVGSPTFVTITWTRLPIGEAGSSRQVQLAATLSF